MMRSTLDQVVTITVALLLIALGASHLQFGVAAIIAEGIGELGLRIGPSLSTVDSTTPIHFKAIMKAQYSSCAGCDDIRTH